METRDAGSDGIPLRDSTGIAVPSREVSQIDNTAPVPLAREENDELEWARKHVPGNRTVRRSAKSVFRKTELLGIAPPVEPEEIKKVRQRTLKNIRDPDGEVAYRSFEDSFRTFVCSLVERQDRIYDEMLLHAADLQQQIDALGRQRAEQQKSPGNAEVKG
ncbi:MAG: hypothetical protein M0Q92_03565 [Methanoregula sp.]|nr:hypothetical protein [Methanoregula sp.]